MKRRLTCLWASVAMVGAFVVGGAQPASADPTPNVGAGNVLLNWSIPNAPPQGLTNITFPMTVNPGTAHLPGTYFAQLFSFTAGNGRGYIGLQPRVDDEGQPILIAYFSSFIPGTTTDDFNCQDKADGGEGVTCLEIVKAVYGRQYQLLVELVGTDTWRGTVRDATGTYVNVGSYRLPSGSGNLNASQEGFVEYYWPVESCATMPRIDVVFGAPTSYYGAGLVGRSEAKEEYGGSCLGQANYRATNTGRTARVTRGFTATAG